MDGKVRSIFAVIFLTIITCGIYGFYWIYITNDELNNFLDVKDTSGGEVVIFSILTCGIYQIYWFYKMGRKISEAQLKKGIESNDDSILYLILCIVRLDIVAMAIIQHNLNNIWQRV